MTNTLANKRQRFLVYVTRWDAYAQWFEASSEAEAIENAEANYAEALEDNWMHKDGDVSGFDVLDVEEIGAAR